MCETNPDATCGEFCDVLNGRIGDVVQGFMR